MTQSVLPFRWLLRSTERRVLPGALFLAALWLGHLAGTEAAFASSYHPSQPLSISTPSAINLGAGLASGEALYANEYLLSSNGQYELDMLPNGIGVLWAILPGTQPCPMWIFPPPTNNVMVNQAWKLSATPAPGDFLFMQADGNFVEYSGSNGAAIWASNTASNPGATLTLQTDGNLVIYQGSTVLWSTASNNYRGPILCRNNTLQPNQGLVQSQFMYSPTDVSAANNVGAFHLLVNTSGELEILSGSKPKKLASGPAGSYLIMQDDGNLVFYPPGSGSAIWATGTNGNPGAVALMSNWGDLFVVNPQTNIILWDSVGKSEGQSLGKAAEIEMDP